MKIGILIKLLLPILIELIGGLEETGECPPGKCAEIRTKASALMNQTGDINAVEVQNFLDFLRCLDIPRAVNAIQELIEVLTDAFNCPPAGQNPDAPIPQ
jgi:hypothetical protein